MTIMDENLLPATVAPKLTYDLLCSRRRYLEQEIALQEEVLKDVFGKLFTPRNVVKAVSGVVFDNLTSGFSLFNAFGQGTRWLRTAIRLIRRFM